VSDFDLLDDDDAPRGPIGDLVIGTISAVDDPDKLDRVRVVFPTISAKVASHWARVVQPAAGAKHGVHWPLEIGDEVVVGFIGGHTELPIVLGALFSKKQPPPAPDGSRRVHRVIQSTAGHTIRLDDTKDAEKLEIVGAKAKESITLSAADGAVTIAAGKKLVIKVGDDITLKLENGAVTLACKTLFMENLEDITLAGKAVNVEGEQDLKLSGQKVTINDTSLEVT
jgi:uncharacterized protein involved in type VI secretion and phage assembly